MSNFFSQIGILQYIYSLTFADSIDNATITNTTNNNNIAISL